MDNSIQVHPIIRATVKDSSINNSWLNRLTYKEDHCIISFSSNNSTSNNNNHKFLSITYKLAAAQFANQYSMGYDETEDDGLWIHFVVKVGWSDRKNTPEKAVS
ncbi:hypothetical protein BGZ89_003992 [Linnemannia elongata]|nr:hypothetical protein BGZ89_003992 [Linnemannia elongata]